MNEPYKPFVYVPLPPGTPLQPSHLRDTEWLFSRDPNKGLAPSTRDMNR